MKNKLNLKILNQVIKEVEECKFNFHAGLDHLEAYINTGIARYWRIGLRIKQDNSDSDPYIFIMYQLRLGEMEFHISPDSIGFKEDAVNKTIEYAKMQFIEHIQSIEVTI